MPSSKQRQDVWFGRRVKTSGGLKKSDLIKNKRGKIVSRKKSGQAGSQNNLGKYLRESGKKVDKSSMLRAKGDIKPDKPEKKKPEPKKPVVKAAPKPAPKKSAPPKPKPAPPKKSAPKPKPKPKKPKKKSKPKINPLTQQPFAKKSGSYVSKGAVHLDNVKLKKRRDAPKETKKLTDAELMELLGI